MTPGQTGRALLTGAALALAAAACSSPAPSSKPADAALVARGEYLVTTSGCHDCHTPLKMGPKGPERDMSRMLSGHPEQLKITTATAVAAPWMALMAQTMTAYSGPWGVSFASNLTPDRNTGIGIWTEDIFVKTMRTGKHWGTSRDILPPMPWENVAKMTDADLKAIFVYLQSIPPIVNHVPDPLPPPAAAAQTDSDRDTRSGGH
jgi:mono/diheme cytochrome c family protein